MKKKDEKPIGKVIIIEGPDLAGKSTIVEGLGKHYPSLIIKDTTRPKDDSFEERRKKKSTYTSVFNFLHSNPTRNIILDRYYPSELVYSLVKRGYDAFADVEYKDFEKWIEKLEQNVYVIICSPPLETLLERFKIRGDDYVNEEDLEEILERYDVFFQETKLNVIKLDTRHTREDLLKEAISFIEHEHKPLEEPKQNKLPFKK